MLRRRRPKIVALLMLLAAGGLVFGGLLTAARREPTFYSAANQPRDSVSPVTPARSMAATQRARTRS